MTTGAEIARVLGGKRSLEAAPRTAADWQAVVGRGMPVGSADALKGRLGVGDDVLAELLGISQKTLSRARAANSLLDAVASDRLFRVGRIAALAIGVLEDEHRALHWLRRAQVGLGGRTPVSMLGTDIGCTEVERLLLRVEHGVYA